MSDSVTERGRVTAEEPACAKASRSDIGEKVQENWRGSGVCREQTGEVKSLSGVRLFANPWIAA